MGTPEFAVPSLKKIIDASHQVVGVFTQPDRPVGRSQKPVAPPVKQLALKYALSVYSPQKITTDEVRQIVSHLNPEVIVVVAYGKILPPWMLELPRFGAINVHASRLPQYRGAAPIQWALAHGETVTGVTTMKMDAGLDTGDILLQHELSISPDDTAQSLHDRLSHLGAELLIETLTALDQGSLRPQKQDDSKATFAPILKKDDGRLDWAWPALKIHNYVRGMNPWPGTYTKFRGKLLRIWKTAISELPKEDEVDSSSMAPGTLIQRAHSVLLVKAGDGKALRLLDVQLEGHRRMSGIDFINGFRISSGEMFS